MLNSSQKQLKSMVIQWSDQQKFRFEKVKATLGKKTVLSYPIPYAETFLSTDASENPIILFFFLNHLLVHGQLERTSNIAFF